MSLTDKDSYQEKSYSKEFDQTFPRVLYCNIAFMKEYCGITENDRPRNGSSYVGNEGDAFEKYSFFPAEGGIVRGLVETKHHKGYKDPEAIPNQLRIENIDQRYKKEKSIDDVLVIYTATGDKGRVIVGWYESATVYRGRIDYVIDGEKLQYNIKTVSGNAYLIPEELRDFKIPSSGRAAGFGMGQSNIRYIRNDADKEFTKGVIDYLEKVKKYTKRA